MSKVWNDRVSRNSLILIKQGWLIHYISCGGGRSEYWLKGTPRPSFEGALLFSLCLFFFFLRFKYDSLFLVRLSLASEGARGDCNSALLLLLLSFCKSKRQTYKKLKLVTYEVEWETLTLTGKLSCSEVSVRATTLRVVRDMRFLGLLLTASFGFGWEGTCASTSIIWGSKSH